MSTPTLDVAAPVDSLGRVTTGEAAALMALAAAHQSTQGELSRTVQEALARLWWTVEFTDLSAGWARVAARAKADVVAAQRAAVVDSGSYVRRALAVQGVDVEAPRLDPAAFSGLAGDGRSLDGLLLGGVVTTKRMLAAGHSREDSLLAGERFLRIVAQGEVVEARSAGDQSALVAATQETTFGWVRMITPPACGRCAVLAGAFYRWNQGFQRHEGCDCVHIPAKESISDSITTDPMKYFESLTPDQQAKYFGKANAQAIDAGADLGRTMRAATRQGALYTQGGRRYTKEATSKRGYYRKTTEAGQNREKRLTPYQIMRDAAGNKGEALRLLVRYGYVVR